VFDLEFARDGTHLAAACEGGLTVWKLHGIMVNTVPRCVMTLHSSIRCGNVTSVAIHRDGRLAATLGRDIRLWSFPDGRQIAALPLPAGATRVEFSRDGQFLLAVAGRRALVGWPVGDTPEKRRLHGPRKGATPAGEFGPHGEKYGVGVPGVAFSPDGRTLASVSKDQVVRIWDPATGELPRHSWGHNGAIEAVAFSPDGRLMATGDVDGDVYLWDPATMTEAVRRERQPADPIYRRAERLDPPGQVWRIQFDATGEQLAVGGLRGVAVWSLRRGADGLEVQRRWTVLGPQAYDLAFHPSGKSLAYVAKEKEGRAGLYRYELNGEAARQLPAASRLQLRGLNFDPEGRLLTFVTPEGTLGRWDWEHGVSVPPGPDLPVSQWAPSPDGHWAAVAGPDNGVVVCHLETGLRVLTLPPEESEVWSVAWAPDGQRLALGLANGSVTVWDLEQVRARLAEFGIDVPSLRPPR
ncbi:MAG TPA: hypothetical protein VFW33_20245, partial [Gemmataceae bacterium]|nr:hypothetical protein [Gemmataceae bacterium]